MSIPTRFVHSSDIGDEPCCQLAQEVVLYADHVAAVAEAEQRVRRDVDDVWVTQHDDHITWEWKGDTGYALVQREVLELLLARCNEPTYTSGVQAARDAVVPWLPHSADCNIRHYEGVCDCECAPMLAAIDNLLKGEQA